jgi:hypothetical protein
MAEALRGPEGERAMIYLLLQKNKKTQEEEPLGVYMTEAHAKGDKEECEVANKTWSQDALSYRVVMVTGYVEV